MEARRREDGGAGRAVAVKWDAASGWVVVCGPDRRLGEAAQDELQFADVVLDGEASRLLGVDAQVDDDGLGARGFARRCVTRWRDDASRAGVRGGGGGGNLKGKRL